MATDEKAKNSDLEQEIAETARAIYTGAQIVNGFRNEII